jgi:CMP-N-acetylneuraminic acid synthetase|tara:strand:- start:1555 stop:2319 length:765 start_codon:yes stop_codon:yes gene_type:complete
MIKKLINYKEKNMLNKKKNIYALITARKGSKGIKDKNLKKIKKKTLVEITIDKVKKIKKIDKIFCSSDDKRIEKICRINKINFIERPKNLALDNSSSFSVVRHFANYLKKRKISMPFVVLLLQSTSPFLKKSSIIKVINSYNKYYQANSINTFIDVEHKYYMQNFAKIKNNKVSYLNRKLREKSKPRQKIDKFFVHGNLHSFKLNQALKKENLFPKPTYSVILENRFESIDIDDEYSLFLSRLLVSKSKKNILS